MLGSFFLIYFTLGFLPLFSLFFGLFFGVFFGGIFVNYIVVFSWRHYEKLSPRHLGLPSSYIIFHQFSIIERIFSDTHVYQNRERFIGLQEKTTSKSS